MQRREQQASDERGADGDVGRLAIADLANHDDVRVLPKERSQSAGEVDARRRIHRDLRDARKRVLDGIFDGRDVDHVLPLGAEARKNRVERRRLSGAGRPCDEDHSVRTRDVAQHDLVAVGREPQPLEVDRHVLLAQHAHDDLFPPVGGKRGDAEIELERAEVALEASILRRSPVVDAHARQRLDAH